MINLLIADDHAVFIEGLKTALKGAQDIFIKQTAKNGCEVLKKLKQSDYDVLLLDVDMPVMNGIDCAKRIRKLQYKTKVIILTQFGEKRLVDRLVKQEISGYLLKSASKDEIIQAIYDVHENKSCFSEEVKPDNIKVRRISRFDYIECKFSGQQTQVLKLICEGFTNNEIAKKLNISIHSVETVRHRIMNKTGMRNTAELVKWTMENDVIDLHA